MPSRFHSAIVDVRDFDSAVADYSRLLGQPARWIETNAEQATRSVLFPLANMMLELRTADAPRAEPNAKEEGLSGIRLGCDDMKSASDRLQAARFSILPSVCEIASTLEGPGSRAWTTSKVDPGASRSISIELISDEAGHRPERHDARAHDGKRADGAGPQPSSIDPESMIRALDHVVVMSGDIEATRNFYHEGLGIRLALDRSFEKRGVRLVFFRIGGTTIEIGGRLGVAPSPDATDRFGGLAWQVPSVDAIHARLSADRFDVSEIRDGNKAGTRVCTVRDPVHNVPTLLIQPVS